MPRPDGGRDGAAEGTGVAALRSRLGTAAAAAYADLRLAPVLRGLLAATGSVTGPAAGAVSLVDGDRYTKAAEQGVACQVGSSFPLDEGATGRAVALRRPVVLRDYADLARGHLPARTAAGHRSALAVPVWWRGDVIAVNVVFRPPGAGFSTGVVDAVEAVTQTVAPALHLVRPDAARTLAAALRTGRPRLRITETGGARPVPDTVATAAADVLTALDAVLGTPDPPQRVGIVHRPAGLRLLVQREAPGAVDAAAVLAALRAVVGPRAEAVLVELVPGWGLAVQVDLPDPVPAPPAGPLTDREREVLGLLRRGLTDRAMAAALGRSPKTVEKHVAALIRKTGALNRTAAVAAAMERGWLPDR